jgi:sulfonate transport system substrate-binding protein
MKKLLSPLLTALIGILIGTGLPTFLRADEIRIATQPIPHYAPIFVAREKKWVEEELRKAGFPAVAIKWASFSAGPPINESFAAGQQDFGLMGDTPAIIAKSAGIDTLVVALASYGPKSLAVIVPTNSSIKSPKDLKGKKVAVVKGSYTHHLLVLVLQHAGLTTGDIQLINLSQADIATAIVNGDIAAAAVWEPLITHLETQGIARVLADGTGIKKGVLVIVVTNDFLVKHRSQVKAVLRAYQRGADFIKSNPKDAARLITADVSLPPDLLHKVFTKFNYNPAIHADDIEELKKSEAFMKSAGLIRASVNIDDFVDTGIGREAGLK